MYQSRRDGRLMTTVQVHPFRMLMLAAALIAMAIAAIASGTLWGFVAIPLAGAGCYIAAAAGRQLVRGVRSLLS